MILGSGLYDYILIDSRTGFSDEGSICTRDLADHIFVIMGLNRQNVEGTGRFLERLDQSGWREEQGGEVVFVASPVPQGQEPLVEERLNSARKRFANTRIQPDFNLRVPYHPRLSLDEEPFGFDWSHTEIFPAYRQIHDKLSALADDPFTVSVALGVINQGKFDDAVSLLKALSVDDPNEVMVFLDQLIQSQLPSNTELRDHAEPFFDLWLTLATVGGNQRLWILILSTFALYLIGRGSYQRAEELLKLARQTDASAAIPRDQGFVCQFLGTLAHLRGKYDEAIDQFEDAAEYFDAANLPGNRADALCRAGSVRAELQRFDMALELFDRVSGYWKSIGYTPGEIQVKMAVGIMKTYSAEYDAGLHLIGEANAGYEQLGAQGWLASGRVNYAWALLRTKNIEAAKAELDKHWDHVQKWADAASRYEAYVLRAKIKKAHGDEDGARNDARVAVDFYRAQDVQTKLAAEAEELANSGEKETSSEN